MERGGELVCGSDELVQRSGFGRKDTDRSGVAGSGDHHNDFDGHDNIHF